MSKPIPPTYKTTNWASYNAALKRRGSLTIWFDPLMTWDAIPSGKRGRQQTYSDAAIQTCLTLKVVFGMALRQTTGFVTSLLKLANLDWLVPDFSTLSRRQKDLAVSISCRKSSEPLWILREVRRFRTDHTLTREARHGRPHGAFYIRGICGVSC